MSSVEGRMARLIDEAIERERAAVEREIHEIAQRVLAERLAAVGWTEDAAAQEGEWLDRAQIEEQYGIPYWKIRDLQVSGQMYSRRQGKKVLSKREDVDERFQRMAS